MSTDTLTSATSIETSKHLHQVHKRKSAGKSILFHGFMLALLVVVLYPVVWMIASTFKPSADIIGSVSLIPKTASWDNYITALGGIGGTSFWTFVINSLILAIGSVLGVLLSCSMAAYAFARLDFPGQNVFFALMIFTLLLPFHVVVIPQYIVFNMLGLVDTFVPLLVGKFLATDAFFVFLMVQFIRGLPPSLDEAARIDGAGHVRVFTSIILPLMRPAMVTSSLFAFIWSWNDFFGPLIYLKSPNMATLPVALRLYVDQTTNSDFGAQMAMAVLALIPVAIFFAIFQRQLVEGVATQGIKG